MVCEYGILTPGRLQFTMLQVDTNLRIGIMCIYAYNDSAARVHLWRRICEAQLLTAQWILCGDFNQVKDPNDKKGGDLYIGMNS